MHEFSIATEILDIVTRTIGEPRPVQSVRLRLGPLSGICAESLRFCFTELAEQYGIGRAELAIDEVPAELRCRECGDIHHTNDLARGCPRCQSLNREILSGYECIVDSVTLQEDDDVDCPQAR